MTVQDFTDVGNISLVMNFDKTVFAYQSPTAITLNGGISGSLYNVGILGKFILSWTSETGLTLPDNTVLLTLHFNLLPSASLMSTTDITWGAGECEYASTGLVPTVYSSTFNNLSAWSIPVRPVKNIISNMEYCTIQPAVDGASPNDILEVSNGTYYENVTINKIGLVVRNATGAVPIIDASGNGVVVNITADNVSLEGFTLTGSGTTAFDAGVFLNSVSGCTITGNTMQNNANGIAVAVGSGNIITSNDVNNNSLYGIALAGSSNNTIISNSINSNGLDAIALDNAAAAGGPASMGSNGNHIKTNTISSLRDGIFFGENCDNNFVTDANVLDNIASIGVSLWRPGSQTITDNTISNALTGIRLLGSSDNTITGNTITGNNIGIKVDPSWQVGVWYPSINNTISGNRIAGNTTYGMQADNEQQTSVNAENNWWGDATGPYNDPNNTCGLGNEVTAKVDFIPWWTTPTGVDGSGTLAIHNTTQDIWYCKIQDAINGADPDDIIKIEAASHTEGPQIVVDKDITIMGLGKALTTVQMDGNTGSSGDSRGWFLVNPGVNLNMSDLTLDGTGHLIWQAVRHLGSGTFNNCNFTNIKYNESSSYAGTAIAVFGGLNVDISNTEFSEIGRIGVQYFGAGTTGTYDGNTYTGKGSGDWLDYGVEVGAGANAIITNSAITANQGEASDNSTSAGILVTTYFGGGTTANISGCTLTDNTDGIAVGYDDTDNSVVFANHNQIYGNTYGITSTGPEVNAKNNWWGDATGPYNDPNNTCGLGNEVTSHVDFLPWWTTPTGVDGSGLLAIHNTTQNIWYCQIQDAIYSADPDDIIKIEVASHTEGPQIVVDRNITIMGLGKTLTTVHMDGNTGNGGDPRGWFLVNSGINLNMSDLTLDGTGHLIWQAIRHKGSGTFNNCNFTNIKYNESTSYAGTAIAIFSALSVDITNCEFSDIGRVGVLYYGAGTTGTYDGNTYTGKGSGDWLDYAVEVGAGANAIITNSAITANQGEASDNSTSAGILVTTYFGGGTTANISGCTLTGNTAGIAVGFDGDDNSVVVANHNQIYGNTYGITATGPEVNAENNWWGDATGPFNDPNNTCGLGNEVTSHVGFLPWWTTPTGVDGSGSLAVHNTTQDTWYCKIQDAIDDPVTVNGDVIFAEPGTYNETLVINKDITLQGANHGVPCFQGRVTETTLTGNGSAPITIASDGVTIDGLEITNTAGNNAIVSSGWNDLTVLCNYIHDIGTLPVLSGNTYAVAVVMSTTADIDNVQIADNCFNDIMGGENPILTGAAAKSNNGSAGAIGVGWSNAGFDITNLLIDDNVITNVSACTNAWDEGGKGAYGIMINVGSGGSYVGKAVAPVVHYNSISALEGRWAHGIGLEGETPNALVQNNEIFNLTDYKDPSDAAGVQIEDNDGAGSVLINNNSFTSMSLGVQNVTTFQVDATCNWYGATDGASVAAMINGPATYASWLISGNDNNTTDPGFVPDLNSCLGSPLVINAAVTDESCPCSFTGAIDITVTGGSESYTYSWSPGGETTEDLSGLTGGDYTVNVIDDYGSTASLTVTVATTPDDTDPLISCPGNITKNTDPGVCEAVVNWMPDGTLTLPSAGSYVTGCHYLWQSFTASSTGILTKIDMSTQTVSGNWNVTIYDGEGVDGCVLYNNPSFTPVTGSFSLPIPRSAGVYVESGHKYTLSIVGGGSRCVNPATVDIYVSYNGSVLYPGGLYWDDASFVDPICTGSENLVGSAGSHLVCLKITVHVDKLVAPFAVSDDCHVKYLTLNPENGSTFLKGTTQVTATVTDFGGNTADCNFEVTVVDLQNPTITCPPEIIDAKTSDNGTGDCSTTVSLGTPVTGDNCTVDEVIAQVGGNTIDPLTYEFPSGATTVTWIVTDGDDNSAQCDQSVTVADDEAPVISLTGDATVHVCQYSTYNDAGATAADNCNGDLTTSIVVINSVNVNVPGSYTVTYDVADASSNNAIQITRTVIVDQLTTVTAVDLTYSDDAGVSWQSAGGDIIQGYDMCLDRSLEYLLDLNTMTLDPAGDLETLTMNPFTLTNTSDPTSFFDYWANRGVDGLATYGDWRDQMWLIINGNAPFFYIKYDGSDYKLIDGLQYFLFGSEPILSLPGDYPEATYTYNGSVVGANGCTSLPFDVVMIFNSVPVITCPADITVNNDSGECGAEVSFDATATGVPAPSISFDIAGTAITSPYTFPVGITTVNATASSSCGTDVCSFTVTVVDAEDPVITCPADLTLNQHDGRDPYATGYATATDNCSGIVSITYDDDRSGLNSCNATGDIIRTWTAKDAANNSITCQQIITIVDNDNPEAVCPSDITVNNDAGLCSAVVNFTPTATDFGFFQGFENSDWVSGTWRPQPDMGPSTDWNDYNSVVTRVTSGTDGITSKTGNAHAVINSSILPPAPDDWSGIFCRLGGYDNAFNEGFISSIDVYFDLGDPDVGTLTYGWDVSTAISNQAGGHLRDFIFHTADNGAGEILVAVDNNTNYARRDDLEAQNHYNVTATGWYTLEWVFRDNGVGALAVDCNLRDEGGSLLWTETRSNASDLIASLVGGNRYMWFTFVNPDKLAIDNTSLTRLVPIAAVPPSGNAFSVGTTAVNVTATDACSNTGTCSFDVTVNDSENPTISCPSDITVNMNDGCDYIGSIGMASANDNCSVASIKAYVGGTEINPSSVDFGAGTTTVTWIVLDVSNNSNTCDQDVTVVLNEISGTLKYNNSAKTPMNNVTLSLSPGSHAPSITDANGYFSFPDLCAGTYTISVTNNNKAVGGINSTDAGAANYWNVYGGAIDFVKFLAGDVNLDDYVNGTDASRIQYYFVFGQSFDRAPWSYWKKGVIISNNPDYEHPLPENFDVIVTDDVPDFDLYAQCTGDFGGSFIPGNAKAASSTIQLTYDESMQAGADMELDLPIRIVHSSALGAVSLILDYPSDLMEVLDVRIPGNEGNLSWSLAGNELRLGWNSLQPLWLSANDELLVIHLKTSKDFRDGDVIRIELAPDPMNELADGSFNVIPDAVLEVNLLEYSMYGIYEPPSGTSLTLESRPNPFKNYTMLSYNLPLEGHVTLQVTDMLGRKVALLKDAREISGKYTIKLDAIPLQPGIYTATLTLQTSNGDMVRTIKLVRNR